MTNETDTKNSETSTNEHPQQPKMFIVSQFIRDLSFETINLRTQQNPMPRPEINLNIDTRAQPLENGHFEVQIIVRIEGQEKEKDEVKPLFVIECIYAGIFTLENIDKELIESYLIIEGGRMLFPYVRMIISQISQNGGIPPLILDPIDFMALYLNKVKAYEQSLKEQEAKETDKKEEIGTPAGSA